MKNMIELFLLYRKFTITTNLRPEEIRQKLLSVTDIVKPGHFCVGLPQRSPKKLSGFIEGDNFKLFYIPIGLILMEGKIKGSIIECSCRLNRLFKAFFILWLFTTIVWSINYGMASIKVLFEEMPVHQTSMVKYFAAQIVSCGFLIYIFSIIILPLSTKYIKSKLSELFVS